MTITPVPPPPRSAQVLREDGTFTQVWSGWIRRLSLATGVGINFIGNTVTPTKAGIAPATGGGTVNFLRADATWVAPPGGSITAKQVSIVLPAPARSSHSVTVVDASITSASKILLSLAGIAASAVNESDDIDLLDMMAIPAVGSFTFKARFLNPISGPLLVNYLVG